MFAGCVLVGLASADALGGANPDVEATGSSYGAASAAAHSARLHSAFTGAASLSGTQEAAKTELALKAWLKHQSAAQLAYIEKTPAAADDIDVKTWAKYYNEAVDRTSVRRWHKELAATHKATHTVWSTTATTAAFDKQGRFMPPKNVAYNIEATKLCCKMTCGHQNFDNVKVGGQRVDPASCRTGCDLWLHQSSLNWEDLAWRPKLMERCKRDCSSARSWDKRVAMNQYWQKYDHTLEPLNPESVYWVKYKDQLMPRLEDHCRKGCENYMMCMNKANDDMKPEEKKAFEAARVERLHEAHALWMKSEGMKHTPGAPAHKIVENIQAFEDNKLHNGPIEVTGENKGVLAAEQAKLVASEKAEKAIRMAQLAELAKGRLSDVKKVPKSQLSWSAKMTPGPR